MSSGEAHREETTREEVRPGLVMVKRRTRMEDGRTLIYFDFEREAPEPGVPAAEGTG